MLKQNLIEVFWNDGGSVTLKYAAVDEEKQNIDIEMLVIKPADLKVIGEALIDISYEIEEEG